MARFALILSLATLAACSGLTQLGGSQVGKCFVGELSANNPLGSPSAPAPTGQITFSAPAGAHVAICSW